MGIATVFYNNNPTTHDGVGWYFRFPPHQSIYGPFDTEQEAKTYKGDLSNEWFEDKALWEELSAKDEYDYTLHSKHRHEPWEYTG